MNPANVLIISDDADFSRRITQRWQEERSVPAFTLLSGDLWPRRADHFEVAIVGQLRKEVLPLILSSLHDMAQPLFCVCEDAEMAGIVRQRWPKALPLQMSENWLEGLVLAGGEAVRRVAAEAAARLAEQRSAALEREASLGRYMLGMRHGLNNALTSLLGNSDLLCMDAESLPLAARGQVETVRNMTLRIHEVMQRFSSMENELNVAARQTERESTLWQAAAAGKN